MKIILEVAFSMIFLSLSSCDNRNHNKQYEIKVTIHNINEKIRHASIENTASPLTPNGVHAVEKQLLIRILSKYSVGKVFVKKTSLNNGYIDMYTGKSILVEFEPNKYIAFCDEGNEWVDMKSVNMKLYDQISGFGGSFD